MVQKMDSDLPDFVGREKEGQAALRRLCFRAAEGVEKTCLWRPDSPERRDFPFGPAKRVCHGSTGVERFFDFRRLGVPSYHFIIFYFMVNTFLYTENKRVILILKALLEKPPTILPKKKKKRPVKAALNVFTTE